MGVLHLKIGGPCHVDAIAVVLALEDYQNSIAKNLRVKPWSHLTVMNVVDRSGG